jgi:hypothetical protein
MVLSFRMILVTTFLMIVFLGMIKFLVNTNILISNSINCLIDY